MSLADFSTVKANSTASGELCLAPQLMGTEEDTGEEEVECRGVISRQSIYMSVVSPLMCWLRVGPPKRVKIESWASVSADKSSETDLIRWRFFFFFFHREHLGLHGTKMLYCLLLSQGKLREWVSPSHTGSSPALTRLFALQSAKQISLPLENQVNQTFQHCAAQLTALEHHPPCDKRYETISWPPTTTESQLLWLHVDLDMT